MCHHWAELESPLSTSLGSFAHAKFARWIDIAVGKVIWASLVVTSQPERTRTEYKPSEDFLALRKLQCAFLLPPNTGFDR